MHIYSSAERDVFDKSLNEFCERLLFCVFENDLEFIGRSDEEKQRMFVIGKACCYGLVSGWLLKGMDDSGCAMLHSFCDKYVGKT